MAGRGATYTIADYTTNYVYDVLDDLTQVNTSQASRNRTFSYDGLGRLTSATNPENGTVQYSLYDGNGNLKTKVANGITTSYVYDELNRLKQRSYSDNITPTVNYIYDINEGGSPNYPIGRLSQVSTTALGSQSATQMTYVQYDAMGRVLASQQTTGTQTFPSFTYIYNDQDLDTEIYPSGRKVQTCYDPAGRVKQLTNVTQAGLPAYASLSYTLANGTSKTTTTLGNTLIETATTNNRLQTASIQVGNLLSLAYSYGTTNNNGNPLSQTITRSGQTWVQSYAYTDGLNRLTCANENPSTGVACGTGSPNWMRAFGYDPFGNGWVVSNTNSTLVLNSFTPTVPTNFDSTNYLQLQGAAYDPSGSGNQTAIGGFTLTYDAENRMTSSSLTGTTTIYGYDGDGRRVTKTTGGVTTMYVYDAMGQLAAEYGPSSGVSGTSYVSVDSLGSTRLVTDASGNPQRCYDYLPFGEELASGTDGRTANCFTSTAVPMTQKFTGKERDAEMGLDFFGARYLSGAQGRFTSVDPAFESGILDLPQTWIRYSYVYNRPLFATDPDGRCPPCAGAIAGGIAEGLWSVGKQLYDNGGDLSKVSPQQVIGDVVGGAVAGGLAASGGGFFGTAALEGVSALIAEGSIGAVSNAAGTIATGVVTGEPEKDGDISGALAYGFAGGVAGRLAADVIHPPNPGPRPKAGRRKIATWETNNRASQSVVRRQVAFGTVISVAATHGTKLLVGAASSEWDSLSPSWKSFLTFGLWQDPAPIPPPPPPVPPGGSGVICYCYASVP